MIWFVVLVLYLCLICALSGVKLGIYGASSARKQSQEQFQSLSQSQKDITTSNDKENKASAQPTKSIEKAEKTEKKQGSKAWLFEMGCF